MKTEEWKAKLMDYLYDEMEPHEKIAFEKELEVNPTLREELSLLKNDQSTLAELKDEPVSAPPFFKVYKNGVSNNSGGLKWFMAVAASLLLLMVAAKLTGLEISNQKGEFRIAFGQKSQPDEQVDKSEIEHMVHLALTNYEEKLDAERKEDMDYLFAKMELMESDKDLFKIETGQLINSLANNQQEEQAY